MDVAFIDTCTWTDRMQEQNHIWNLNKPSCGHRKTKDPEGEDSEGDGTLVNNDTLTQPHITFHTPPVSASPFIHSLPLHEAVKQTPLQVPKDPRGQEGEAERGWWDTLFKPPTHTHKHTHTHLHSLLLPFPICLIPCIIHYPPCSSLLLPAPLTLSVPISFSL